HRGYKEIKKDLQAKMFEASEQLNFERAKEYRDQISHIEVVMEQQKIILNESVDMDVFGYGYDKGWMCVQVFFVRQGKLIERDVSLFPYFDEPQETLLSYIGRFYLHQHHPIPKQILLPIGTDIEIVKELLNVDVHTPF